MADESRSQPPAHPSPHETYRTAQTLSAGQLVLERYTLRKFLGRGGFGVVWLAKDEELDLEVAIKFLSDLIVNNPEAVADLKRETRHSLRLTHPNIVRIHGFLQGPQIAGISMEYVDGGTMSGLKADRPQRCFNVSEIAPVIAQLIDALDYAHTRAQIVHRDLKPGNLMLTSSGELKVADFGISRSISDTHTRLSEASPTSGTPAYMSPQQMMGQAPRVTDDIYSLGATIYDLLAGKPPFYTGDVPSQVLRVTPPPIAQRRQELEIEGAEPVAPEWEKALATCLAKAPESRPPNVREVAALLGIPVPTRPLTDSRPPTTGGIGGLAGEGSDSGRMSTDGSGGASRSQVSAVPPAGATGGEASPTQTPAGPWNQEAPKPKKNALPLVLAGVSLVALAVSSYFYLNRPTGAPPATTGVTRSAATSDHANPPAEVSKQPTGTEPSTSAPAGGAGGAAEVDAPTGTATTAAGLPPDPGVEARMARLVELSESVPGHLTSRRWDLAQRQLQEIATIDPNLPQLSIWQAELNAGRNAERSLKLREAVQTALAARQWDAAERENEQLLALIPGDPQGMAWRTAISAARHSDAAPPAAPPAAPGSDVAATPPRPADQAPSDDRAIRSVLEAYARSLEALDIDRYATLWRSISADERGKLTQAFGQIRSQTVELTLATVEPAGTTAVATGQERRRVEMKQGSPQSIQLNVRFTLEKGADGRWQIVRREYR